MLKAAALADNFTVIQLARTLSTGVLLVGLQVIGLGQSVSLSIGSAAGTPGGTVSLPINLTSSGGAQAAGLQWSFVYSSDITSVSVVAGPSAISASKNITCSGNNCLLLGFNSTAMADGTVATATFHISSAPSATSIPVQISGVVATSAGGDSIPASGGAGTITLPALPPGVSVSLSPSSATLTASQTKQFAATVTGSSTTSVTWSMSPSVGSLSNGLYTAPSVISSAQSVIITATSVADSTKSASATVQLTPVVSISMSPLSATLTASQSKQFTATVTGSSNTSVNWSMTPSLGSLLNGLYTAPSLISSAQAVTITATSVADPTKSASATVQLTAIVTIGVSISPLTTTLTASQTTQFTATVTNTGNTAVTWSMNPASFGSLSNGLYTAPSSINNSKTVTITATSVADPTKSASASVQLSPASGTSVSVSVSPSSSTITGSQSTQFTATVSGSSNTSVSWSMSPAIGTLSNGFYTAPSTISTAQSVIITATSVADPTKSASATVQLMPPAGTSLSISINPLTAILAASQTTQFTATVAGSSNTAVTWSMSSPSIGTLSNGLYTAPSTINSSKLVTITATSVADPTKSASAAVQLTATAGGVSVNVSPSSSTLTPAQSLQFAAMVIGSTNTSVTWSMSPSLGALFNGLYTAPSVITNAQSVTITATSVADPTQSASATVHLKAKTGGGPVNITSPTTQPMFTSAQNTLTLAGTAPADTTQIMWTTDQGIQGQAAGTATWAASGIVLRNGSNIITVTANDGAGDQNSVQVTVFFSAPSIVTTSLPDAQLGKAYSAKLAALGGTPPFTWSALGVPDGLTVSKEGMITGTPTAAGTFTLNITLTDSTQAVATAAVKLKVDDGLVLMSAASMKPGPVAPESMVTVYGGQLAAGTQSATSQPLPTTLGDCTVTIKDSNGVERLAPLYYVSPNQINFTVPADTAPGTATITVTSGDQTHTLGTLEIAITAPGLFFLNTDGLAAASLTRVSGGKTSYEDVARLDATTNLFVAVPVDLGSDADQVYLTLYGTGLRLRSSLSAVQVVIGGVPVTADYAGSSDTVEGLDSVHMLLPKELRGAGMADVVVTVNGVSSNGVRILIK